MKIEYLGKIVQIHTSGIVETDKGYRYPDSSAKMGDILVKIGYERKVLSQEEYSVLKEKHDAPKEQEKHDAPKEQEKHDAPKEQEKHDAPKEQEKQKNLFAKEAKK